MFQNQKFTKLCTDIWKKGKMKMNKEAPLQSFTEPNEVDCFTCKHGRCKSDGKGGFTVYCKHPKNTRETNYKYATECRDNSVNRYSHWELYCDSDETNQAAKADAGKPQLTLVPRQILFDIARVREYGTEKYGDPDNWKQVEIQRYKDAAFRHFMAYLDDPQGNDEESGLSHLAHLACNIAFLCEMEARKNI